MRKAPLVFLALVVIAHAIPDDHDHDHGHNDNNHSMNSVEASPPNPPHGHEHGHSMGPPLPHINETEILQHHAPDPLSYWAHDLGYTLGEDGVSVVPAAPDAAQRTYPILMALHVACMTLGFFAVLPIGIVLRSARHKYHIIAQTAFYLLVTVGWLLAVIYGNLTPHLYEGEKHSLTGYFALFVVAVIATYDFFRVLGRIYNFIRNGSLSPHIFWNTVIRGSSSAQDSGSTAEYSAFRNQPDDNEHSCLVSGISERYDSSEHGDEPEFHSVDFRHPKDMRNHDDLAITATNEKPNNVCASHEHHSHRREYSTSSTLRDEPFSSDLSSELLGRRRMQQHVLMGTKDECDDDEVADMEEELKDPDNRAQRALSWLVYLAEWGLVAFAYVEFVAGTVVYSGICRATYAPGCLAHLIKGSIFFLYGVVTFCRYLGAFAAYGWAWNRPPTRGHGVNRASPYPTAEMVECSVIFMYGITNTWLERLGAQPGDPYTTRQIQHISIAVMYWFGGLIGIALESKRVRRLIALSAYRPGSRALLGPNEVSEKGGRGLGEPATYTGSFNPIPALVIGITGAAMAAHHQTYLFAVRVHELWGNMLLAFSVLRCMTYIFLWLRPPTAQKSVLPSRPPTEALAALFLACGGLIFISSTEQIEFAAMRSGHDDIMMILNLVVSIVCIIFCWSLLTLAVKGWARSNAHKSTHATDASVSASIGGPITV